MAARLDTIDLDRLGLTPGQGTRIEVDVDPGSFDLGGITYGLGDRSMPARVEISRTAAGYALRLRFTADLSGPCVRCLEDATLPIEIDSREVDQPASRDEELLSPYVSDAILDLSGWAHDALVLALPQQVVCREDCAGLCPVCGESLNGPDGEHDHPSEPDPRLAKLRELLD